uniref:Fatty acyl-CoA reductase n=1 Tax=Timema monikensis TaxID=170555 RepID=A0A7R9EKK3_9NEOP|nr:unnamed protein product [Timema monikensis]
MGPSSTIPTANTRLLNANIPLQHLHGSLPPIIGTRSEPLPGWIDNVYGPTGIVVGAGIGILRTINMDPCISANLVPVDMAVGALIASAREVHNTQRIDHIYPSIRSLLRPTILIDSSTHIFLRAFEDGQHYTQPIRRTSETIKNDKISFSLFRNFCFNMCRKLGDSEGIPIYNYVSSAQKPIQWREFVDMANSHAVRRSQKPKDTKEPLGQPHTTGKQSVSSEADNKQLQTQPPRHALSWSVVVGLFKVYRKIHRLSGVLTYFCTRNWDFSDDNVQTLWKNLGPEDKKLFDFDISSLDWNQYIYNYVRGCRVHLLKDDLSTVPESRIRWQRLYWLHQTVKTVLIIAAFRILWFIFMFILRLIY